MKNNSGCSNNIPDYNAGDCDKFYIHDYSTGKSKEIKNVETIIFERTDALLSKPDLKIKERELTFDLRNKDIIIYRDKSKVVNPVELKIAITGDNIKEPIPETFYIEKSDYDLIISRYKS